MHEKEKIIIFLKYIGGNPYQHNHGISSPSVEHTDYSALKVEKLRQNIPKLYFFFQYFRALYKYQAYNLLGHVF